MPEAKAKVSGANGPNKAVLSSAAVYHVRFRNFHAGLGCWIIKDPIGYLGDNNTFNYCSSKPVDDIDSSGLIRASLTYRFGDALFYNGGVLGGGRNARRLPKGWRFYITDNWQIDSYLEAPDNRIIKKKWRNVFCIGNTRIWRGSL